VYSLISSTYLLKQKQKKEEKIKKKKKRKKIGNGETGWRWGQSPCHHPWWYW
jgi:hypothetical protein